MKNLNNTFFLMFGIIILLFIVTILRYGNPFVVISYFQQNDLNLTPIKIILSMFIPTFIIGLIFVFPFKKNN